LLFFFLLLLYNGELITESLLNHFFCHTFQLRPWWWQSDTELSLRVWRCGCIWCHSSSRFAGSNIQHRHSVWNLRHWSCQIHHTEGKATVNCVISACWCFYEGCSI